MRYFVRKISGKSSTNIKCEVWSDLDLVGRIPIPGRDILVKDFENSIHNLARSYSANWILIMENHRGSEYLLSSFVREIPQPVNLEKPEDAYLFVRSIPIQPPANSNQWPTPDFLLLNRAGSLVSHILLLVSLLLGLESRAFVCLGTIPGNVKHIWAGEFMTNISEKCQDDEIVVR